MTTKRVIYKHGLVRRMTSEMNMDKIELVIVTQSIAGRVLDYGSIYVMGTGEGMEHLHNCSTARVAQLHRSAVAGSANRTTAVIYILTMVDPARPVHTKLAAADTIGALWLG